MANYKAQFFDNLVKNLKTKEKELDSEKNGSLNKTIRNTCLFAKAMHETFNDMGDVAGMMVMNACCDYSLIDKK